VNPKNILSYDISWRIKNLSTPRDKHIGAYKRFLKTNKPSYVSDALAIYKDPMLKLYLECMLLADFTVDECVEYFGCDNKSIEFYKKMFFDIDCVSNSKAKLLMIARDCRANEGSLKLCAVNFGKEFIKWHLGIDKNLSDDFIRRVKRRLIDGVALKSLGHEFIDATSGNMGGYLKMLSAIKNDPRFDDKSDGDTETEIMLHLKQCFNAKKGD
jgi:hypothetical protein